MMEIDRFSSLQRKSLKADLCIIGGGMAGICAAIAAARNGVKVVLMHDRPVLGGNASSEIRMWVRGAHGSNCRETGLVEELILENHYSNPTNNMSLWDAVLYGKTQYQDNLTLLLNTSCLDAKVEGDRILSVTGWQLNAETFVTVEADYFADCSGDGILGALTPAEFRYGREARGEFDESIEREQADMCTMGNSCLLQAREHETPIPFVAPDWVDQYTSPDDLPDGRGYELIFDQNFWYVEVGGNGDVVHDVNVQRERLLRIALGLWNYLKNFSPEKDQWANWELDWVGFLPGKRESRRFVGDYIMNQNDVAAAGPFFDTVAYGGWTMDDHHPDGFDYPGPPNIFHPAPSPFGIPYRSLYSVNMANLWFAGRNISVSHAALSATRVMATCATIGEAVGYAAAIAVSNGISPRQVGKDHTVELQQMLLENDCFLPKVQRQIPELTRMATLRVSDGSDASPLLDGWDRPIGEDDHSWTGQCGSWLQLEWDKPVMPKRLRLVLDSDLNRQDRTTISIRFLDFPLQEVPKTLVRDFSVSYCTPTGEWKELVSVKGNYQRLVCLPVNQELTALRVTLERGGQQELKLFALDVK